MRRNKHGLSMRLRGRRLAVRCAALERNVGVGQGPFGKTFGALLIGFGRAVHDVNGGVHNGAQPKDQPSFIDLEAW